MSDPCSIARCRSDADLIYLGHGICSFHWDRLTAEDQPAGALAKALGIPAATTATTEDPMSEKKADSKTTKTTRTKKAQPKPKTEKQPREDRAGWGVFAFRLPVAEREAFHTAAGPAGASRTLRALADAFVREDRAVFESIVEEARKLR